MPVADDESVVANAQRLTHVVVGDEHANAALFEEADDALNLDHGNRVDTGEGLVEQNKARLGSQRTRDFDAAALTTGQRQRRRLPQVLNTQLLQQAGQTVFNFFAAQRLAMLIFLQLQHGSDIVFHAEFAKNRGFLGQIGQAQA